MDAGGPAFSPWPEPGELSARRVPGALFPGQDFEQARELPDAIMDAWRARTDEVPGPRKAHRKGPKPASERESRSLTPGVILRASPAGELRQDISSTAALLEAARRIVRQRKAGGESWLVARRTEADGWMGPNPTDSGHIPGPHSHLDSLLPGAASPAFTITYRSESFSFDAGTWLDEWMFEYAGFDLGLDRMTSPLDVTARLWDPLYDQYVAAGGNSRTLGYFIGILGCYGLPTTTMSAEMDYVFWYGFFGAPFTLWMYSCAMVYAFADEASDQTTSSDCGGASCCAGYTTFLRTVIAGGSSGVPSHSTTRPPTSSCMNIHFIGGAYGATPAAACDTLVPDKVCDEYSLACVGAGWNDWYTALGAGSTFADIIAPGHYIYDPGSVASPASEADCGADNAAPTGPQTGCGNNWYGDNWNVTFGAAPLAFDGYTSDVIMFLSQLVYDYTRANERPYYWDGWKIKANAAYFDGMDTARRISSYALRIAAQWGYHLVHEIGHTYNGDYHCTPWSCCFELAAQRWLCKVEGLLGLPFCEYYTDPTDGSGDWDSTSYSDIAENCGDSCSGCSTETPSYTCTTTTPGEPVAGADVTFAAASCTAPTTETPWP